MEPTEKTSLMRNVVVTVIVAIIMAGFVLTYTALLPAAAKMGGTMAGEGVPNFPSVKGYAEGREIYFIHSEASDPMIAKTLSDMMQSPVLVVPVLAGAGEALTANVYVFANGVEGAGPLGFQPDVFDHPPGATGYSPLRAVHVVTWKDEGRARELRSASEVADAQAAGEVTIDQPGVVVNMPMLTWSGGGR